MDRLFSRVVDPVQLAHRLGILLALVVGVSLGRQRVAGDLAAGERGGEPFYEMAVVEVVDQFSVAVRYMVRVSEVAHEDAVEQRRQTDRRCGGVCLRAVGCHAYRTGCRTQESTEVGAACDHGLVSMQHDSRQCWPD